MKNAEIIMSSALFASIFLSACGRPEEKPRPTNPPEKTSTAGTGKSGESAGKTSSPTEFVPPNKLVPFKSFSEQSSGERPGVFQSTVPALSGAPGTSVVTNITNNPGVATSTAPAQAPAAIPVQKRPVYPH
ncbi:MAG: hypothetical protein COT17_02885 [Elusimicrobia bacterium CG08_land_8_20_14_0_20_51_18]|nr:MAG: hypothetical protein COT17_02885 [Elusimicrobia bacterium CG08_land_8_20_14_0_20_51_18]